MGNYLFMGKGIRIVGVELVKLLNRVPIPQNATFSGGSAVGMSDGFF
jgi:hypothetical protein